jgi:flagellar basal-body rod modification protein FlgD
MTVSSVTNPTNAQAAASAASSAASTAAAASSATVSALSVNDFLTLLTTQLKNQNPDQPVDPATFVSQLAQFGTVTGIQSMQASLSSLSSTLLSNQAMAGVNLVGRQVLAQANSVQYSAGQSMSGAVQVPTGAGSVAVKITDGSGAVVQQISVGTATGLNGFTWNGIEANGTSAPSGTYSVQAIASVGGKATAAQTYLEGTVQSVSLNSTGSSGVTLNTPELGAVPMTSVQQIN